MFTPSRGLETYFLDLQKTMDGTRRILSESTLTSSFYLNGRNILSQRQKDELNASVLQYLKPILASEPEVYDIIVKKLIETGDDGRSDKYKTLMKYPDIPENYLEKKWSTVLRLQRNIQELESINEQLQQENEKLNANSSNTVSFSIDPGNSSKLEWLPSMIKSTLTYHTSPITAVVIHPSNPYLITASQDGMMVFWDMLDFSEPLNIIKNAHSKSINCLVFQPSSSLLISCSADQIIKLWDLKNIEDVKIPSKILTGHEHIVSSLAVSPSNSDVLISSSRDKSIKVWDLNSGWALHTINIHSDWVRSVDVCDDYILSGSSDSSIRLTYWPTQTPIGLCLGHKQVIEDVKFFPTTSNKYLDKLKSKSKLDDKIYDRINFKYAVSCGRDKLIKIWRLPTPFLDAHSDKPTSNKLNPYGECIMELKGHQSWVRKLLVHFNGRFLFSSADDNMIKIWDLDQLTNQSIEPIKTLRGHQSFVNTISIAHPKGDELTDDNIRCYLISGGADNLVNVWV